MAKKALLIGCNYPRMREDKLRGCINDVMRVKSCLIDRYGFLEENIVVLIDTDPSSIQPTGKNILLQLSLLVEMARPGDVLVVHYSGHGMRLVTNNGFIQCIVPTDYNLITDYDFRKIVDRVPKDCVITIIADCCHSGGLIKATEEQIGVNTSWFGIVYETIVSLFRTKHLESHAIHGDYYSFVKNRSLPVSTLIDILKLKTGKDDIDEENLIPTLCDMFKEDASPALKNFMKFGLNNLQLGGDGGILGVVDRQEAYSRSTTSSIRDCEILLSASQSDQKAKELSFSRNSYEAYGIFSNAILAIIEETHGVVTNKELVLNTRKIIKSQRFTQIPGLYCSDRHVDAHFVCDLTEKEVPKMEALLTGQAEVGKLEEKKEVLEANIEDKLQWEQSMDEPFDNAIEVPKMEALLTGQAEVGKLEEKKEVLEANIEDKLQWEQSMDEPFDYAFER